MPSRSTASKSLLRIRNLLVTRQLYAQLEREQQRLEQAVEERTRALASTHIEIVERLARAAEYRDDDTGEHTQPGRPPRRRSWRGGSACPMTTPR